jgi:predicted aldo/keto reductase-like oxidoreductase
MTVSMQDGFPAPHIRFVYKYVRAVTTPDGKKTSKMITGVLGKTNLRVSVVGFGALTIGYHQKNLDITEGAELIRYALEQGLNFIDTAQYYRTYPQIRAALKGGAFEPIISSKSLCRDEKSMRAAVEEARCALDRDVIEIFLLHELRHGDDFQSRQGAWEYLCEAKVKGLIKAAGISTHHVDVALTAAKNPEMDVLFPLINYRSLGIRKGEGTGSKEEMAEAIRVAADSGIGVYAMKVFGGGNLVNDYFTALDYLQNISGVTSMMIGFSGRHEIDRIIEYVEGNIDRDYRPDVAAKRIRVVQGDCSGCGGCISRCPNHAISYNSSGLAEVDEDICLTCGYCAPVCPTRALVYF